MNAVKNRASPAHQETDSELPAFACTGCVRSHAISMYAIAQMAMGHTLDHTCQCGKQHTLRHKGGDYRIKEKRL